MLNRIIIMGRLARDPELRRTQNGTPVASFRLAVDRDFKDKATGERSTDWIDVVAWGATAEFFSRFFTKGRSRCRECVFRRLQARRRSARIRRQLWRQQLRRRQLFCPLRRLWRPCRRQLRRAQQRSPVRIC